MNLSTIEGDISYNVSIKRNLSPLDESKLVDTLFGAIYVTSRDTYKQTEIGTFEATLVKTSRLCESNEHPLDVLDQTQSIADVASAILGENEEPIEEIKELFGDELSGDFVIIEQIELDQEWRGSKIGLAVMHDFITSFIGYDTLVVLEAAPLTKNVKNVSRKEIDRQSSKLAKHWKKLGFKKVPNSNFLGLSTNCRIPKIKMAA